MESIAMQALAALGLVLLISAYLLNRRQVWLPDSAAYLAANAVGALFLTVYSLYIREWVFVALEGFWSVVSFLPLLFRKVSAA